MTQDAIVTRLLPNNMAEVVVARTTACGGNCGSCETCMFQNELKTAARNLIGAQPGQRVVIESSSARVFSAVALVYVMPIVLFLVGFAVAYLLGAGEGVCVLVSFLALALSAVIIVQTQKAKKKDREITFDIITLR